MIDGLAGASAGLKLAGNDVDLWFVDCEQIRDPRVLGRYRSMLSCDELVKQSRFVFARDRHRYLVARALLRTVLSGYFPISPERWRFRLSAFGKPEVDLGASACAPISFNVSHSEGLIVVAVSKRGCLGVDTENSLHREAPLAVADSLFSARESADLWCCAPEQQRERFFEYWTLKEAYVKARGMGLSLALDQFSFNFVEDAIHLSIQPALGDDPMRWQFWQFRLAAGHLIAVCRERLDGAPSSVRVRHLVPLVSPARDWPVAPYRVTPQTR